MGEGIVHGHAYDTKHTTLSSVNVFPYKLKAWIRRDVSLEVGDIRMGLEESFFFCVSWPRGGRENPKLGVDKICMASEASPETLGCYCLQLCSFEHEAKVPEGAGVWGKEYRGHLRDGERRFEELVSIDM